MSRPRLLLIGGGVRSGKSAFALELAHRLGERRIFVATAPALDDEMRDRIARHVAERGDAFATVEAPLDLPGALAAIFADPATDVAVVDCLTIWISNLLVGGADLPAVEAAVEELAAVLARRRCHVVIVSNEVGMGVVPPSPLGRAFRDAVGRAHQRLTRIADEIHLAAMGVVLRLRPAPVEVVWPPPPPDSDGSDDRDRDHDGTRDPDGARDLARR